MAAWPALTPDEIEFTAGTPAVISVEFEGHGPVQYTLRSPVRRASLTVTYRQRTPAVIQEFRACNQLRRGDSISFVLPNEVFAGHANRSDINSFFSRWRFDGEPREEDHGHLITWSATLKEVS